MDAPKFLIIDGNSIAYRAFYALPFLHNKRGEHTNAIYGFTNMLMGILEKVNPDYTAVVFDTAAPTFRHLIYEDYKAQREETPSELSEQILHIKELVDAFNIPVFELDGYEADDIIGSLAKRAEKEGIEALLFSGDKDLFQLISETTKVILVRKGISDMQEYDLARLKERYNLTPEQIVDLKALEGDPSDNIPGVPGIGEKTALKLLQQYRNLDHLLSSTEDLQGKLREKLEENKEQAALSRQLALINCYIDELDFTWEQCRYSSPDYQRLRDIFMDLDFKQLLEKLPSDLSFESVTPAKDQTPEMEEVKSISQIMEIKKSVPDNEELAIALEPGKGYPTWKYAPVAVAFAYKDSPAYYLSPALFDAEDWKPVFRELWSAENQIRVWGHNIKQLINLLGYLDLPLPSPVFDSMLAAYLLEPGRGSLDVRSILQEYLDLDLFPGRGKKEAQSGEDICRALAAEVFYYFDLQKAMEAELIANGLSSLYFNLELPLSLVLSHMEREGICVEKETLNSLSAEINVTIGKLRKEIFILAGEEFNLNSPRQLATILFEKLDMPVKKKTKTGYSTDVNVLMELARDYDIAEKILQYRQLEKLDNTYLSGLLPYIDEETGKIFTTFNQTITTTGRLSSKEPNLQNIPVRLDEGRRIRQAFVPSHQRNIFMGADYSQIELRILAHLSEDPTLLEAFRSDEDIHQRTAAEIFNVAREEVSSAMRKRAKAVNFGIVYGISDYGLAQDLKISRKEAQKYIDSYFERYEGVKEYMEKIVEKAREQGYVSTLFNRRRYLPEINDKNFSRRSFAERTARNTPIQGSAADIIKQAMLRVYKQLEEQNFAARLLLQVHDELIVELPGEERLMVAAILKEEMENAAELIVPVKVDISYGNNWYELG